MASRQGITTALAAVETVYGERAKATPERVTVWLTAVGEELSDSQLEAALALHLKDPEAGRFPPTPADLIGRIRSPRLEHETAAADLEAFVGRALELVAGKRYYRYSAHGGSYDTRFMREELGAVVVEAFEQAGGPEAWMDLESSKFARKEFSRVLRERLGHEVAIGRFDVARALTSSPPIELPRPRRALPEPDRELPREQAAEFMDELERRAQLGPKPSERLGACLLLEIPKAGDLDSRLAKLKRQRDELLRDGE